MVAFLYRMPAGIAGDINRVAQGTTVETQIADPAATFPEYGIAVVIDATTHQARPATTGDAAAAIYGALARPYPTNSGTSGLGTSVPPTSGPVDVMKRGYMTVQIQDGSTPAKNGAVTVVLGGGFDGQFSATAADGTHIAAPAYFMGPADANGNVEIAFNI